MSLLMSLSGVKRTCVVTAAVEIRMLARPRLTKPPDETAVERPKDQTRPKEERFLLRVDGQTKRSFSSKDPAVTAGAAIKKAYPLVMVTIVDADEGTIEVIKVS
jgi:hypothetical protein